MSKRAGAVSEETRERLLAAAEEEFSTRGFQGSSLRRICTSAGVTTGALYFFFRGKDDLFRTVLAQVTEPFSKLLEEHYVRERTSSRRDSVEGRDEDFEVSRLLIELYFDHQQTWDILSHHLDHPAVQTFLDHFIDSSAIHYQELLKETPGSPVMDEFAIHQFVHMQVDTMLTLISHGFSKEDMIKHSKIVICMLRGAFQALLTMEC